MICPNCGCDSDDDDGFMDGPSEFDIAHGLDGKTRPARLATDSPIMCPNIFLNWLLSFFPCPYIVRTHVGQAAQRYAGGH